MSHISAHKRVGLSNEVGASWTHICIFLFQGTFYATCHNSIPAPEVRSAIADDRKPGPTRWNQRMTLLLFWMLPEATEITCIRVPLSQSSTETKSSHLCLPNTRVGTVQLGGSIYGYTNSQLFFTFKVKDFDKAGWLVARKDFKDIRQAGGTQ